MNTRTVIVANGNLDSSVMTKIHNGDHIIGVDRAAYWLIKKGCIPQCAIGDFDSCTNEEIIEIQRNIPDTRVFKPEKDFTDTELAFEEALRHSPSEILILGGWGTRLDHSLAALSLLEKGVDLKVRVVFENSTNSAELLSRGRTILTKREEYRYISILPYSETISISLSGLKYPLDHATIARGQTIGVSNEFTQDQAVATIHAGLVLVIQSRD